MAEQLTKMDRGKRKRPRKGARPLTKPIQPRYLEDPLPNEEPIVPDPESTDYRSISEKKIYGQFYFNAKMRSFLREFTVSGVKLVFDNRKSNIALKKLSNKNNIGRIMILADTVHVNIPLRFPQTEVVIFARQLVFGDQGSIDLTPISNTVRPGKRKIPVGSGKFQGIDGNDGNDAGSILLSVNSLNIPETNKNRPTIRIIARGADGQQGGDGGLVQESLGQKEPPPNVTWKMFRDKLFKTPFCTIPFGIPVSLEVAEATGGLISKLFGGPSMEGWVTEHWKPPFESHYVLHVAAHIVLPPGTYLRRWNFELGKKISPLNGSDAYPSGKPGKGGNGGTVTLLGKLAFYSDDSRDDPLRAFELKEPPQFPFSTLVDVSEGKAGTSKKMEGQLPALKKSPASFGTLSISFDGVNPCESYRPEVVTPRKGKDAAAPTADNGAVGQVIENRDESTPFIHEYNAEAMLNYARDACMAQNRNLAKQVVAAYLEGINNVREHTTPRIDALKAEMDTLNQQLNSDVDIYGNQRGWVPYLSVVAAKDMFDATAKSAFNSMYLCGKMKDRYETMADNLDCLSATREEREGKLVNARKELETAQDQYLRLQEQFDDINGHIVTLQAEVVGLNKEIQQWAELDEKNKALYAGLAETVGGAVQLLGAGIQCIPVGQPATGIVGGFIQFGGETGGNIVSSLIEGCDIFDAAGQLTEGADAFFKQNKDDIAKAVSKTAFKKDNENLKVAQKKYKEIGDKAKALAERKALLKDLVGAKADATTLEFERLYREQSELATTGKKVSKDAAKKKWIAFAQATISERIKELEKKPGSEKEKGEYRATIKKLLKHSKEAETLADDVAKYAKTKKDKEEAVETVLNGLTKTKGGFLQAINGIRKMTMRREDLEPKIEAHIKKLEGTVYAKRFEDLANKLAILNNEKEDFIREFERCEVTINNATSEIGSRMAQMDTIDDSTLGISGALDHSVYSALVSLDNDSRAMLREQLYYFAKSYEYRTLKKVDPNFYKLDQFVKKLENFLKTDTSGDKVTLTEEQYDEIYELLTGRLRDFVKPLIEDLETGRLLRKAPWLISARQLMDEHTFQKLNTQRKDGTYEPLAFNLVKCGFGEPTIQKYRIVSLNLKEVKMANPEEAKRQQSNFTLEFEHSGVSTLYDGNEFYRFRSQSEDERIRWTFTCSVDSDGICRIDPYETEYRDIELVKKFLDDLCDKKTDVEQLSAPYRPGAFSDLTLVREKSGIMKERVKIEDFVLEVVLEGIM